MVGESGMSFLKLSNKEQNLLAEWGLELAVCMYFFWKVLGLDISADDFRAQVLGIVATIISASILFSIVVFSIINYRGEEAPDERGRLVAARARNVGYWVLFCGICAVIGLITLGWQAHWLSHLPSFFQNIDMHYLLLGLVGVLSLASLLETSCHMYWYRWGRF